MISEMFSGITVDTQMANKMWDTTSGPLHNRGNVYQIKRIVVISSFFFKKKEKTIILNNVWPFMLQI